MTRISATRLRQNLYTILDEVIESGIPVEIERKEHILKIVPEKPASRLARLKGHSVIKGDPEDLVHLNWSSLWKGRNDLP